jgi:hypothetical protein
MISALQGTRNLTLVMTVFAFLFSMAYATAPMVPFPSRSILSALTIAARSHDSKEFYATVIRHALHRQFDTPQGFLVLGLKPSSPASPPHYRKGMWNAIHARLRAGSAGADGTPHL